MDSILQSLPTDGALFAGRVGAVRLSTEPVRSLLVDAGHARIEGDVAEPPGNLVEAPGEGLLVRRPAYLDLAPLFGATEAPPRDFWDLWHRRDDPDSYVRLDPYTGGLIRVAQAMRNAVDFEPRALSCELHFGDIADPEVAYQLTRCVAGIADAARMFHLPVISRTLETAAELGLAPRVMVGAHGAAVGVVRNARSDQVGGPTLPAAREPIVVIGRSTEDLSGSLYLGDRPSLTPPIDLVAETRVIEVVRAAQEWLHWGTPVGRGGLVLTLARHLGESGVRLTLPAVWTQFSLAAAWFGEAQSRFVVTLSAADIPRLEELARPLAVPVATVGSAGGDRLVVDGLIDIGVKELDEWQN
ncbi:MAG: hypothetical protein JOZ39_09410 [Chloroflexi bacterium]|nr:hypothetical protein [Chloroflexota bacterium]